MVTKDADDQQLNKRRVERQQKEKTDTAKGMSIADRLTRRARQQKIKLVLEDDLGTFEIEMQEPTRTQVDDLLKFSQNVQDETKQDEANKQLNRLLADLCIDESLDENYWSQGNYSLSDVMDMITTLNNRILTKYKDVESFRAVGHGTGPISDVRISEQVTS